MEQRRKPIGEILINMGLISKQDVAQALGHQRKHGGFFGDALINLGLATETEVEWGLAKQYDLAFVSLRPENIDRETAASVPVEWARAHLILPVLRSADTVTVILADTTNLHRVDEVRYFTPAVRFEAALSNPTAIRELIDAVHGEAAEPPSEFGRWIGEAIASGATSVGISVRGNQAWAWCRGAGRSPHSLRASWQRELEQIVSPFLPEPTSGMRRWPALLYAQGAAWRVECQAVGAGKNWEWMAEIRTPLPKGFPHVQVDARIHQAIDEGLQNGALAVRVRDSAEAVGAGVESLFPVLPGMLREGRVRSFHLTDRLVAVPADILTVRIAGTPEETIRSLQEFAPDALTLDVDHLTSSDLAAALQVSPLVLFRTRAGDVEEPFAGLTLSLRLVGEELLWTSYPFLHATD